MLIKRQLQQAAKTILLGLVFVSLCSGQQSRIATARSSGSVASHVAEAESLSQAFRAAADAILPSVVKIRTETKGRTERN